MIFTLMIHFCLVKPKLVGGGKYEVERESENGNGNGRWKISMNETPG